MASNVALKRTWLIAKLAMLFFLPFYLMSKSLDVLEHERSFCLFKTFLGHECWGCGLFKATVACVKLEFARAFHYNRLIVIVFPMLLYFWGKELFLTIKTLIKG